MLHTIRARFAVATVVLLLSFFGGQQQSFAQADSAGQQANPYIEHFESLSFNERIRIMQGGRTQFNASVSGSDIQWVDFLQAIVEGTITHKELSNKVTKKFFSTAEFAHGDSKMKENALLAWIREAKKLKQEDNGRRAVVRLIRKRFRDTDLDVFADNRIIYEASHYSELVNYLAMLLIRRIYDADSSDTHRIIYENLTTLAERKPHLFTKHVAKRLMNQVKKEWKRSLAQKNIVEGARLASHADPNMIIVADLTLADWQSSWEQLSEISFNLDELADNWPTDFDNLRAVVRAERDTQVYWRYRLPFESGLLNAMSAYGFRWKHQHFGGYRLHHFNVTLRDPAYSTLSILQHCGDKAEVAIPLLFTMLTGEVIDDKGQAKVLQSKAEWHPEIRKQIPSVLESISIKAPVEVRRRIAKSLARLLFDQDPEMRDEAARTLSSGFLDQKSAYAEQVMRKVRGAGARSSASRAFMQLAQAIQEHGQTKK